MEWLSRTSTRIQLYKMSHSFPQGLFQSAFPQQHIQHLYWLISCQHLVLTDWVSVADRVHVNGSSLRLSFEMSSFYMPINHLCYFFCKIPFFTCLLNCVNCIYLWKLWIVFWILIFCWLCMLSVLSPRLWYTLSCDEALGIEVLDFNVF